MVRLLQAYSILTPTNIFSLGLLSNADRQPLSPTSALAPEDEEESYEYLRARFFNMDDADLTSIRLDYLAENKKLHKYIERAELGRWGQAAVVLAQDDLEYEARGGKFGTEGGEDAGMVAEALGGLQDEDGDVEME